MAKLEATSRISTPALAGNSGYPGFAPITTWQPKSRRLPATTIESLVRGGLSGAEIYQLVVPRITLAHRVVRRQSLSQEESDEAVGWLA